MGLEVNLYKYTKPNGSIGKIVCPVIEFLNGSQISNNIENDAVKEYNNHVHYSKGYLVKAVNVSNLTNYPSLIVPYLSLRTMDQPYSSWTEICRPVIIKDTTAGNTLMLRSANFTHTVPCTQGATLVYNLVPGETYQWSESSTGRIGNFTTEGQIRMIKIGLYNFRDLGGWPCYDDNGNVIGHIKYGQLYRGMGFVIGGNPYGLSYADHPEVVNELINLGITDDIDLRGYEGTPTSENPWHALNPGYPTIDGKKIAYHQGEIPTYTFKSKSNSNFTYGYSTKTRAAYKNLIVHLNTIAGEGKSSYVHCATGADRTGVLIAIVMALLGCSLEDIAKEYELTSFNGMGYTVNIGYVNSGGEMAGVASNQNIRTFLTSFNTSSTTTSISIVKAIVNWVKSFTRTDGITWDEYINILKTKMIKYN